jgi:hypothetical protein
VWGTDRGVLQVCDEPVPFWNPDVFVPVHLHLRHPVIVMLKDPALAKHLPTTSEKNLTSPSVAPPGFEPQHPVMLW